MKYKEWLNEWLDYYVKSTTKERTYNKYRRIVENHITPALGNYEMDELTANVLQRFTVNLTEKGLSANTVNVFLSVIKSSLRRAVLFGITDKEYSSAIVRPKVREKRVECFSKDEQKKIESYISAKDKPKLFGIVLCLYTGLRIGELLALEWSDIDLSKGTISISKTCQDSWINGQYVKAIDTPKTECSQRTIPIPKQLMARIKDQRKLANGSFVISGKSAYGIGVRSYQRTFETLLKNLNIPHKGFHSLRHTFATRALECGMDIKTLSEILGHTNASITLKRYAHSMLEHKTEMMNRVGKFLL
ncbi:MAG: site-specific integrase [Clostridia bacterium]|nr:site-specific integrase [Clostridia bacterium]